MKVHETLQLALCHLFFNITGIVIWYPIPVLRRVPIRLAKFLGNTTADYRWFAVSYLIVLYFIVPLAVFGLSLAGWYVLLAVLLPVVVLIVIIVVINVLQSRRPSWLPAVLRSWEWLPLPLRSLKPYDDVITVCCKRKHCNGCCRHDDHLIVDLDTSPPVNGHCNKDRKSLSTDGEQDQAFDEKNNESESRM